MMNKYLKLFISLVIPLLIGFGGSNFTSASINSGWYDSLQKPVFNPPSVVFGPVWTLLYLLIGFSFFLIWNSSTNENTKTAYFVYSIQLFLNFLWSILFFGLKNPALGLVGILILLVSIIFNIKVFYQLNKTSAYLLVPYLFWVSFATVLNFFIFSMNK